LAEYDEVKLADLYREGLLSSEEYDVGETTTAS
jgi:hypothetical protein